MLLRSTSFGQIQFIGFHDELAVQALAKRDQGWRTEGAFLLEGIEADEVLVVRVLGDGCHELAVGQAQMFLQDEGAERHAQGLCRAASFAGEHLSILLFQLCPRDTGSRQNPPVVHVQLHTTRLVEVEEGDLMVGMGLVHGARS